MYFAFTRRFVTRVIVLVAVLSLGWLVHFFHRAYQLETLFDPNKIVYNFCNMHRLFHTALVRKSAPVLVLEETPSNYFRRSGSRTP